MSFIQFKEPIDFSKDKGVVIVLYKDQFYNVITKISKNTSDDEVLRLSHRSSMQLTNFDQRFIGASHQGIVIVHSMSELRKLNKIKSFSELRAKGWLR